MQDPHTVDWLNLEQVIAYAKSMGSGHTVFKRPKRDNYNITHTIHEADRGISAEWVKFRS